MKIRLYYDGKIPHYGNYPYETIEVSNWTEFWDKRYKHGDFIYCRGKLGEDEVHLRKDSVIKIVGVC